MTTFERRETAVAVPVREAVKGGIPIWELVKVARGKGEDAKVSIRSVRRHAKDALDKLARDGAAGEDEVRRAEAELDRTTGKYTAQVDEVVKAKEAELLEV